MIREARNSERRRERESEIGGVIAGGEFGAHIHIGVYC